jgi:hypothetical protein
MSESTDLIHEIVQANKKEARYIVMNFKYRLSYTNIRTSRLGRLRERSRPQYRLEIGIPPSHSSSRAAPPSDLQARGAIAETVMGKRGTVLNSPTALTLSNSRGEGAVRENQIGSEVVKVHSIGCARVGMYVCSFVRRCEGWRW